MREEASYESILSRLKGGFEDGFPHWTPFDFRI